MDYPTISEYTEHLRLDKASLRNYLTAAGISTQESDTFTELVQAALAANGALRCIYVQPDEPLGKEGIWFKRNTTVVDFDAVSTSVPFVDEVYVNETNSIATIPGRSYYATVFKQYNNNLYAAQIRNAAGSGADALTETTPVLYFYKYNKNTRAWAQKQSYTYNEFITARGEAYYTATSPTLFQKLGSFNTNTKCWTPDTNDNYIYWWGGTTVNDASTGYGRDDARRIARFGLSGHSATRLKTTTYGAHHLAQVVFHNNVLWALGFNFPSGNYPPGVAARTAIGANDTSLDLYSNGGLLLRGSNITPYDGTPLIYQLDGIRAGNSNNNNNVICLNLETAQQVFSITRPQYQDPSFFGSSGFCRIGNIIYSDARVAYNNYHRICNKFNLEGINSNTRGVEVARTSFTSNATTLAYYDSTNNQIVSVPAVTGGAPFEWKLNLLGATYNKDTVILNQSESNYSAYHTNLYTTNQFVSDLKYSFEDAWFYGENTGYEKTLPVYYGDGTQWIKFKN